MEVNKLLILLRLLKVREWILDMFFESYYGITLEIVVRILMFDMK